MNLIVYQKRSALLRERDKLDQNLGGLLDMTQIPDIAIVVDPKRESTAIAECKTWYYHNFNTDTNCDPNNVDIPIPANDDAVRSINYFNLIGFHSKGKQSSMSYNN